MSNTTLPTKKDIMLKRELLEIPSSPPVPSNAGSRHAMLMHRSLGSAAVSKSNLHCSNCSKYSE